MSSYDFYVSHLRFVAGRTEAATQDMAEMMAELTRIADEIEQVGRFSVPFDKAQVAGRGLAGVAGFLQQHILPEVVAAKNEAGERQVRWVIDTSMSIMADLMVHAETQTDGAPREIKLPPPPLLN